MSNGKRNQERSINDKTFKTDSCQSKSGGGRLVAPKTAFTLAEVLVTLGIIGVVSAMTVPSLMQNHQRKTYVTQLHKVYNELSQALMQYQTDKNAVNLTEAGLNSEAAFGVFLKKYFNVVQDCGQEMTPCFSNEYKKISGVNVAFSCTANCSVLASGAAIGTYHEIEAYGKKSIIAIPVDINGQKGPNILGRDAFFMLLFKNGVIDDMNVDPDVPPSKEAREKIAAGCFTDNSSEWHGCLSKILNDNWDMTY